jgi:hypothetical protein
MKDHTGRPGPQWAFLEGFDVSKEGDAYLDRLRLVMTPWLGLYLHHIHRPDLDRDPHDHPWWFASLVISGSYTERLWPDKTRSGAVTRRHPRFSVRVVPRRAAHKIESVDGLLWTLVLAGPRRAQWGFWTPSGFVPWREYVQAGQGQ